MGGNYTLTKKETPTLSIFGNNDHDVFQQASAEYRSGFEGYFDEYSHEEKHNFLTVTEELQSKIHALLQFSGVGISEEK